MQMYDLIMLAVMGGAILFGLWKGFAWQVASLASIVVSYLVARQFSGSLATWIGGDPAWNRFLAMFLLFFTCSFAIWIAFGFVRSSIERMHLRSFDRQVGAALGAVKGAALCVIITIFSVSLLGENVCRTVCTSRSGHYVANGLARLRGIVPPEIRQYIGPYVDRFNQEMIDHQSGLAETPGEPGMMTPPDVTQPASPVTWPGNGTIPGWQQPLPGSWGMEGAESVGQLEPAGSSINTLPSWNGVIQQVDWGRAAGQAIDGWLNSGQTKR